MPQLVDALKPSYALPELLVELDLVRIPAQAGPRFRRMGVHDSG